jgi:hypothetical protein
MNCSPLWSLLVLGGLGAGCADVENHDHDHDHNHGLITTVNLTFTPVGEDEGVTFTWSDPEADGDPEIDNIVLSDASDEASHETQDYLVDIELWNDLEEPVENVTAEIATANDEHQFFFTGSAVSGPATGENPEALVEHVYADSDAMGFPVGLENTISTIALGEGLLVLTLRHLPPEGGEAVKTADLAEEVASGGFGSIGGDTDIQIEFDMTVE